MASPADRIPDLERLARNVVRMAMEFQWGADWLEDLSAGARSAVRKAAQMAQRQRPDEPMRDDWEAVGLNEIGAVLRSQWPLTMGEVWRNHSVATVDIERLIAYRGKIFHGTGPPAGQISDVEVGGIIQRLEVGFERVRRMLLDDRGEWWPYISAVHSNIPEFRFDRSSSGFYSSQATVVEGDHVTLDARGVNPTGEASGLRYGLLGSDVPELTPAIWNATGSFSFRVPRTPKVTLVLGIAEGEPEDGRFPPERVAFTIKVRPLPAQEG